MAEVPQVCIAAQRRSGAVEAEAEAPETGAAIGCSRRGRVVEAGWRWGTRVWMDKEVGLPTYVLKSLRTCMRRCAK